jgi:hypothetical protein
MLTRRRLIGAAAGAAGLFGLLPRLRFASSRRRRVLLGKVIESDEAGLIITRDGEEFTATLTVGLGSAVSEVPLRKWEPGNGRVYWERAENGFDRDLFVYIEATPQGEESFKVAVAHVTTVERWFTGRPALLRYFDGKPTPLLWCTGDAERQVGRVTSLLHA